IARGEFVALGREVSLGSIDIPVYILAGTNDEVVEPGQLLSIKKLIATPEDSIVTALEPVRHLTLFMGREILARRWSEIGQWLAGSTKERTPGVANTANGP